jgi:hypothetical protein
MSVKCKVCSKSIYPNDPQINLDGTKFHKPCAKCGDCGCQITISNFTKNESPDQTVLLCKIHYFKRFHEGGSYLGGDKFRVKSARDMKPVNPDGLTPVSGSSSPVPATSEPSSSTPEPLVIPSVFKSASSKSVSFPSPVPVKAPSPVVAAEVEEAPKDVPAEVPAPAEEEPLVEKDASESKNDSAEDTLVAGDKANSVDKEAATETETEVAEKLETLDVSSEPTAVDEPAAAAATEDETF